MRNKLQMNNAKFLIDSRYQTAFCLRWDSRRRSWWSGYALPRTAAPARCSPHRDTDRIDNKDYCTAFLSSYDSTNQLFRSTQQIRNIIERGNMTDPLDWRTWPDPNVPIRDHHWGHRVLRDVPRSRERARTTAPAEGGPRCTRVIMFQHGTPSQ
jgi:hypothetical protein